MDVDETIREFIAERGVTRCPPKKAAAPSVPKHQMTARFAMARERWRAARLASPAEAASQLGRVDWAEEKG